MSKFAFWSPYTIENWDFNTPLYRGIGGSETSHVELAERLAARGHDVISYAPINFSGTTHKNVRWFPTEYVEKFAPDNYNWIVYRNPKFFDLKLPKGKFWFMAQDVGYDWTCEQTKKVDKYLCLCKKHASYTKQRTPGVSDKIFIHSNGIRRNLIEDIERENIVRDSNKIIYASSPDRGLLLCLKDWFRVKELHPEACLHIMYGFDNAEKVFEAGNLVLGEELNQIKKLMNQPGVIWRGRLNQIDMIREWFSAGIWWYPNNFAETSCITCMEAQACGAIPVCNDLWALKENVLHGIVLSGIPQEDPVCRISLIWELADLLAHPEKQNQIRPEMMIDARDTFDWEKWVSQLEGWTK